MADREARVSPYGGSEVRVFPRWRIGKSAFAQVAALPLTCQQVIPPAYQDAMGHMNVMWYSHLFSEATGGFFAQIGFNRDYCEQNLAGTFALEVHIRYVAEVLIGKHVSVRTRALDRTTKRLHFMHFLVIDGDQLLSATGEFVSAHIDMRERRMAPLPATIAERFDALVARHESLGWEAPCCGVMRP